MFSLLTPYAHVQSLASLVGFSSSSNAPASSTPSPSPLSPLLSPSPLQQPASAAADASSYFAALRERLADMTTTAVVALKAYTQYAAKYIPERVTVTLEAVVPAELSRAVRGWVEGKGPPGVPRAITPPPSPQTHKPQAQPSTPSPPDAPAAAQQADTEQEPIADDDAAKQEIEHAQHSGSLPPVKAPIAPSPPSPPPPPPPSSPPLSPAVDSAADVIKPHVIPSVTENTESACASFSAAATAACPASIPNLRSIHPARSTIQHNLSELLAEAQEILIINGTNPACISSVTDLIPVTLHFGLPIYVNSLLYTLAAALYKDPVNVFSDEESEAAIPVVCWPDVVKVWRKAYLAARGDLDAAIFHLVSLAHPTRRYLIPMDFEPIVRQVVLLHPAFEFLRPPSSFQDRYVETVIAQLFTIRPIHSHRVSLRDYRKAGLLDLLTRVEQAAVCLGFHIPPQFSYKSFYVIYCKFWKLDGGDGGARDMLLTATDLERYAQGALTPLVCQRVVDLYGSGRVVVRHPAHLQYPPRQHHRDSEADDDYDDEDDDDDDQGQYEDSRSRPEDEEEERALTFMDFVRFIRATEDKSAPESIAYWFQVLDLEQDGAISLLELETVWAWQEERLHTLEDYTFHALLSVIWDTLRVDQSRTSLLLADLRRTPVAAAMVFELLFDARGRECWLRQTGDPAFRAEQTLCVVLEDGDGLCDEYAVMGNEPLLAEARLQQHQQQSARSHFGGDVAKRRVWLTGWPRFVELAYRDLLGGESGDDDGDAA
ncbi:Serine/threonine-protein phosphatase 2A regulatory subunit B'' subunit beta [Geranomyces michiganensis]|nr:Serine/threonine-protein phosphatase 2A regulatory subunit B'' subunit beta [Geranomyces michiganensis]